jgi:nicotinate-nucleotide--dimethylbenzimidazole phosphoribosyltransferase
MLPSEVDAALRAGAQAFERVSERCNPQIVALGDMGSANATSAAAIVCALIDAPAEDVVGRAGDVDEERSRRTLALVASAAERVRGADWRAVAAEVGGYEIVGLAGVLLAAAQARLPILLDGFVVGAAALLARAIEPASVEYCVASHRSREPGHAVVLRALGLGPLLDLDLRLGEGCGAALGFTLCDAAARMVCEMKTHEEVSQSGFE